MADSKSKRGKADRERVSGRQKSEVYYVARKFGVTADAVRAAIKQVGNMRDAVYAALGGKPKRKAKTKRKAKRKAKAKTKRKAKRRAKR